MTVPEGPWYHGTRRGFTRGGVLFPRSAHRGAGTGAPVNPGREQPQEAANWVYLTRNLDLAWAYAWQAPGRGKPKVVVVRPHGTVEADPEHSGAMDAWRAEWATVTEVLLEPAITQEQARQGWVTSQA